MITTYLYALVGFAVIAGLGISVWSFIDTRNRYYKDYIERRSK